MIKVIDTNIILLDATNVVTLGLDGTIVAIPETVIDEADSKKSVLGEIGYQAREFGRLLTKATKASPLTDIPGLYISRYMTCEGTMVWIVGVNEYPPQNFAEEPAIRNDRKILHTAKLIKDANIDTTIFVTNDVMCGIRAEPMGINATDLKEVEEESFTFVKDLLLDDATFSKLHYQPIKEIDPDYSPQFHNYKFMNPETGQVKLGTIAQNGTINILGKESEKELRRQDINPINSDQLFLSYHIQDPFTDIVVAEAAAGTGKTLTALSNAMRLIKSNNPYEAILYIRASIDDVDEIEKVGFLAGNEEKFAVYLHPLEDSLDFIARNRNKASKLKGAEYEEYIDQEIEKIREQYNIQAMTGLGMRGRTFSNTIAIIDEVQGQSKASLQKMMTRFGKNCKIILIGSNKQIDNPYVTKYNNGLSVVLNEATKENSTVNLKAVSLSKIVRSPIAEWAETTFASKGK